MCNKKQTKLFSYVKQQADTDDYSIQRNFKQDTQVLKMCKAHAHSVKIGKQISTGCAMTKNKKISF